MKKLLGLEKKKKGELQSHTITPFLTKNVIKRTFKSKANPEAPQRVKAPKIQRLVTDARIRRKKIVKNMKIKRWRESIEAKDAYKKVYDSWMKEKKEK